jgi:hypothetical protein
MVCSLDKQLQNVDTCDRAVLAAGKGNQAYTARGLRALGMRGGPTYELGTYGDFCLEARAAVHC